MFIIGSFTAKPGMSIPLGISRQSRECLRQGMINNMEFKEIKDKTNDCTRSRADEDADAAVLLIPNAVKVTRERRHTPDCSAVIGNLLNFPKFLKLITVRLVPATRIRLRR